MDSVAALAAALLGGFAAAIAASLRRGVAASCRCFGGSSLALFGWRHVIRNVTLGLISLSGVYTLLRQPTVDLAALAVMAPLALLVAALAIRLDDVVELFRPMSTSGP
ncbi:MauE/DoxX family redox-associated membrane protein [Micromonospora zamorensis]|uniref:MauE/DoxX family redox-associated membrane protein n=1 Tax=Micromonospora zamorensis TaxID=709883 RepID=UPI0033D9F884